MKLLAKGRDLDMSTRQSNWRLLMIVVLVAFSLVMFGCEGEPVLEEDAVDDEEEVVYEDAEFEWTMQVIHNPDQSSYKLNEMAIEEIERATNGRISIDIAPTGTYAGSMEGFEACGDGVFELHSSWPSYAMGTEYAFLPLTTGNMAMEWSDKYMWMYEHGGWDILQEAFDKLDLKLLAVEIWGTEVLHAAEPYESVWDMVGDTKRTADTRIHEEMGIGAVVMPLEEVFTALATGAVDAAEFGHLDYNVGLGLTDVVDYSMWPDFWNVHFVTTVVVNKDAWNQLPSDLQKTLELGFRANEHRHWTRSQYDSAQRFREMVEEDTMQFHRFPKGDFIEMREMMYQIELEEIEDEGGLAAETHRSHHEFMETWYPYKEYASWWGTGLTAHEQFGETIDWYDGIELE